MRWGFDGYGDEDSQADEEATLLVLQQKTARLLHECQCALLGIEPPLQMVSGYREYGSQHELECTWIESVNRHEDYRWTVPQSDPGLSGSEEDELSIIDMYTST